MEKLYKKSSSNIVLGVKKASNIVLDAIKKWLYKPTYPRFGDTCQKKVTPKGVKIVDKYCQILYYVPTNSSNTILDAFFTPNTILGEEKVMLFAIATGEY